MQAQEQAQEFIPIEEIEERQKAIKKIEEDIMGVNDIMKDLAVLIHEQGEYVDSIESHVEVTHSQVQAANIQLEKARNFQSKSRKKQCCLILTLIIIIAIISLIIYLKTKK
ncbi:hypothetical protein HZS_6116 [Henneguya salminicola]|uniref:Syntaxin-7 (Trinotate prediction) n=1 Tax=Henneguya salminicola TaxID=69463 RepID=A0A6G3MGW2_HENSL|nr:hypothetical protein HZS_6116 [Henneguya salminicola]